ncbi:hypothetical protein [Prosthecobacter sp.]|uniref:hypothetical protein n=1 Tax=Prosthecobacter sp. TaxID=1965333 RepID=UPI001DF9D410|nr:hypothetical protein [Prosthecobacter sp.]MCB1277194.1 hypothetical protein [Prosthecobacter sp.]
MSEAAIGSKSLKNCCCGCLGLFALFVVFALIVFDGRIFWTKAAAIETACKWSRMLPPPVPADQIDVKVQGSGFTRTFIVTFTSKPDIILRWLWASSGTEVEFSSIHELEDQVIQVAPGDRAMHAEIRISNNGTEVAIETWWS